MNEQFERFRNDLYEWFPHRRDALMDLLDALSSNTTARSVVELRVNPLFRRTYSSVHDAITQVCIPANKASRIQERQELEQALLHLLIPYLPTPQRPFRLLVTDVTSASRPYARTLSDRTFVYQPNPVKGVKPVTIGHQYSIVALLPEKGHPDEPPWVIPLLLNRVSSTQTKRAAGLEQIRRLLDDETLPFHEELWVNVADSDYSAVTYLGGVTAYSNLITIARFAGNRTVYRTPPPAEDAPGKGHPTWFGAPMSLKNPATWDEPDESAQTACTTRKGKVYTVTIEGWHAMLLRGKRELPMHQHPLTLVRARVFDAQGKLVFARPIWLLVFGQRRREMGVCEVWDAYRQRFDVEHFLRFGKQRLMMDAYQTPDTEHEENWWTLVQLAYLQLWFARTHITSVPRPWERYLPRFRSENVSLSSSTSESEGEQTCPLTDSSDAQQASPAVCSSESQQPSVPESASQNTQAHSPSPSDVQRDIGRVLQHIGTPAQTPTRRGSAPGRASGERLVMRVNVPVIKKSVKKLHQEKQRAP
jgi:hypothetical protein